MENLAKSCDCTNDKCLGCSFRHPLVNIGAIKYCQYNKLRDKEEVFMESAGDNIDGTFRYEDGKCISLPIIKKRKLEVEGRPINELSSEISRIYGEILQLRKIRHEGCDTDLKIAELVGKYASISNKINKVLKDNDLI
jgi:hypothetical protein